MRLWTWKRENLPSVVHALRTAVAATLSAVIARWVGMPEAYWAAIATLVVMQSTWGATWQLSLERIVATAVGAAAGAVEATYFKTNLIACGIGIFLLGVVSMCFRLEKTAYRYASITLAIIVLIPRAAAPWAIALHRFVEVSVGILVALLVVAFWPERPSAARSAET
ncbi:MAG TPA: FUSC family protein [Candidatus Binataceae bacterium]|nr:FUSC family protein [Candidatus Binataceae bacterium]